MKKHLIQTVICILLILCEYSGQCQDPHFSQYTNDPLQLNPALTGAHPDRLLVYVNTRIQWPSISSPNYFQTYLTENVGADVAFGRTGAGWFGVGLSFLGDQAGALYYKANNVSLSVAHHFATKKVGTLSLGFQVAYNDRSIDGNRATFNSEYNPLSNSFIQNGSGESYINTPVRFVDFGAGLFYTIKFRDSSNYYIGGSMNHINKSPDISLLSGNHTIQILPQKITFQVGGGWALNHQSNLSASGLLLWQGKHSWQFNVGLVYKYKLMSGYSFSFGAYYRGLLDAIIPVVRLETPVHFSLGISCDINVSKLVPGSYANGGLEFGLMYKWGHMRKFDVICPEF